MQAEDKYLAIGQHEQTRLYHGLVYRNHKTPSGCDRWLLLLSTNEGFETERAAGEFVNSQFPDVSPLDLKKLSDKNEMDGIPSIPGGAEITLLSFNGLSYDPAPMDEFPCIKVTVGGKNTDISLSVQQLRVLFARGFVEEDVDTNDPNLSCRYTHYRVPNNISSLAD
jgi:hypothetical protein